MMKEKRKFFVRIWKRNLRAWKIWRKMTPNLFLSKLLSSVVQSATPILTLWISARLINELAGACRQEVLWQWVIIQLGCLAVLSIVKGGLKCWSDYEEQAASAVEERVYMDKMLSLDYPDIDRQYVYDMFSQVWQNRNWSGWGLPRVKQQFDDLVTAVVRILGGAGLAITLFTCKVRENSELVFLNHPLWIAGMILGVIFLALIAPICSNRGQKYWSDGAEAMKFSNRSFMFFGLMSFDRKRAMDIRMYDQQENVCGPYFEQDTFSYFVKAAKGPMGLWIALGQCLSGILTGLIYLFVCLKALGGAFGIGSVTQYIGAVINCFRGVSQLLHCWGEMTANADFLEELYQFLDIPNDMYRGSLTTEKRSDRQYEVEFRDVSFQYPDSERWILRHINMKFQVGRRLAIVGVNGSGKTTFIKLLCRLYDPTEGQILLNGIDIRKYRYDDYMDLFSIVFQDYKLLALPLGENVAGRVEYDRERVRKCLHDAGLKEWMEVIPDGLDSYLYKDLNPDGIEVSGGEAQKVAIARALYRNTPFLILDEPTAALDPMAEAEIYSRLNDIIEDRTAVYISHRLSSCKFCDEIAVFHDGKVIQHGTHESLLKEKRGKYFELWNAQAQYYALN